MQFWWCFRCWSGVWLYPHWFQALESWSQSSSSFMPLGPHLPFLASCTCSYRGKHSGLVHSSSYTFQNIPPPHKGMVMSVQVAPLHLSSKTTESRHWEMHNGSINYGLFPRTSVAIALENLYCLLLMTWAFSFHLPFFHHSQEGTVLEKLFWVFRSLTFVSREYILFWSGSASGGPLPLNTEIFPCQIGFSLSLSLFYFWLMIIICYLNSETTRS